MERPIIGEQLQKAEVDFVFAETIPIEVKSSPKITRSFRSFIESYKPPFAVLVTLTTYNKTKIGDTKVFIVPLALLYREL